MSYLKLEKGIPDFSKAVISLWFRVPKESAVAKSHAATGVDPLLFTLPLIIFGKSQKEQPIRYLYGDVSDDPAHPFEAFYGWVEDAGRPAFDVGPSWIGVMPNRDESGTFDLEFNLQLDTYGSYSSLGFVVEAPAIYTVSSSGIAGWTITPKDTSPTIAYGPPEYFYVLTAGRTSPADSTHSLRLEPDKWHHLLLSFDLTGELSVGQPYPKSACKMWYAIDDKDYRGAENLQPNRDMEGSFWGLDDLGPNVIVTKNIYVNSHGSTTSSDFFGVPVPLPSGNYTPSPIPTNGQEFGIPGTLTYVEDIFRVEMAEFQMWTGVTLDTGIEKNRRAFVDKNGEPVDPTATEDDPAPAEKLLGKKPEVLLHGSGDWKTGYNTGTLGIKIETDGTITKLSNGQFKPTGGIEQYDPDPSLEHSTA